MATVPVRSHHQPLHNFPETYFKWGKNHQINNSTSYLRNSEEREGFTPEFVDQHNSTEESGGKNQLNLPYTPSPSPPTSTEKEKPVKSKNSISENEIKSLKSDFGGIKNGISAFDEGVAEGGDSSGKPWNLRPRRAISKPAAAPAASPHDEINDLKNTDFHEKLPVENHQQQPPPKSLRLRGLAENVNVDNRGEKRKLWISLSREEIEEDFFIMTGSKPPRRPKKRTKNVQKFIDNVVPGMWLAGITADYYSIPEGPPKR